MKTPTSNIASRIKELRSQKGVTQKELAEKTGLGYGTIIGYENGQRKPSFESMAALERYFGVSGAYLRGETLTVEDATAIIQLSEASSKNAMKKTLDASVDTIKLCAENASDLGVTSSAVSLLEAVSAELSKPIAVSAGNTQQDLKKLIDELRHVLGKKSGAVDLNALQHIFYNVTRFCDLANSMDASEACRLQRALEDAVEDFRRTLQKYVESIHASIVLPQCIMLRISDQPASAGTGAYLGPDAFTERDVPETPLTRRADFGVPVRGDSMEPKYHDGDIVLVRCGDADPGDIAVVIMDGCGYIKKLGEGQLLSLNSRYAPIPMQEDVRISGKVIGAIPANQARIIMQQ